MATSTADRIDQLDLAIDGLLAAMADTDGTEEYQLPSGVRVRRAAFGPTVVKLQQLRDSLSRSVARASSRRVRVGSFSPAGGIDR